MLRSSERFTYLWWGLPLFCSLSILSNSAQISAVRASSSGFLNLFSPVTIAFAGLERVGTKRPATLDFDGELLAPTLLDLILDAEETQIFVGSQYALVAMQFPVGPIQYCCFCRSDFFVADVLVVVVFFCDDEFFKLYKADYTLYFSTLLFLLIGDDLSCSSLSS